MFILLLKTSWTIVFQRMVVQTAVARGVSNRNQSPSLEAQRAKYSLHNDGFFVLIDPQSQLQQAKLTALFGLEFARSTSWFRVAFGRFPGPFLPILK